MSEMSVHQWMLEAAVLSLAAVWVCLSQQTHSPNVLLPPSLIPEHYDLSLDPRMDQGVFFGIVVITGLAIVETDVIVLHCKSLAINGTRVTDLTDEEAVVLEVVDIQQDLVLQQCHLHLNQSLKVEHEYSIHLEFMGFIGKDGIGLYIDFYMEGKNKQMYKTTVQGEPQNTRKRKLDPSSEIRNQANARERVRTHSVNKAFSTVRSLIPTDPPDRKMSKIETLRMASSYISHLQCQLAAEPGDPQPCKKYQMRTWEESRLTVCTFCAAPQAREFTPPTHYSRQVFSHQRPGYYDVPYSSPYVWDMTNLPDPPATLPTATHPTYYSPPPQYCGVCSENNNMEDHRKYLLLD